MAETGKASLTQEQIRKIEENKRRALAIRATKQNNQHPLSLQPSLKVPVASASTNVSNVRVGAPIPKTNNLKQSVNATAGFESNKASQLATPLNSTSFFKAKITARFELVSRSQFVVHASFHQPMIEIFKTMPSRTYDAKQRQWIFGIEDHDRLLGALLALQPEVTTAALPKYIIETFRSAPAERVIPDADLSCLDASLRQNLMPFQRIGVCFGISRQGRVLIADDMGLGKTIQSLAIAAYYRKEWPLLIISPSSLRYTWEEALKTWVPYGGLEGCAKKPLEIIVLTNSKEFITKHDVLITSYDLLSKRSQELTNRNYQVIIFDESHYLKSSTTARTKAALPLAKAAKRVVLLSGTPALSRPAELHTQMQAIDPKSLPSFHNFGLRYCDAKKTNFGFDYSGSSNMAELQLFLEEKFMIRRLKSDVLTQLPRKQRQMIVLDPSSIKSDSIEMKEKALGMQQGLKGLEQRGMLLSYFHETAEAKKRAVCDYVCDLALQGKKFLVFAHHQLILDALCDTLGENKIRYIRIDGSVSSEQRKMLCDKFQCNTDVLVAVLSISAANAGLTLTAAHLVVFAELFWNPGILTQAEDRAHRIGQQDSVIVQYLVARKTADDHLWPLVQKKLDVLSKAGLSKDNFSEADAKQIIDPKQNVIANYFELLSQENSEELSVECLASGIEAIEGNVPVLKKPRTEDL